jgi:hypothetical protein
MSAYKYRVFCRSLFSAVRADRLIPEELDARLKGSAAVFYSGRHKSLPSTLPEFEKTLTRTLGRKPNPSELEQLNERVHRFQGFQGQPLRCPFDSMFKLHLHADRSDYDIQLSSKEIESRCNVRHPKYGFLDDGLVSIAVPMILRWASLWTQALHRTVNVKAFGANGPENKTTTIGELSSHFRSEDWGLQPPQKGVD